MVSTNTQTNLTINFEAPARCEEAEGWRAQRVGRRQDNSPVVDAFIEGGVRRSADGEVPVEQVCVGGWSCLIVRGWGVGELGSFAD
jgi:hypothetical protein